MPEATALRAVLSCAGGIGAAARNREGANFFFKGGPSENCRSPTLLVLFHGLEGSSRSHSSKVFANFARERGFAFAVPHSCGCSGELNLGPRAYHSGDFEEIGWIFRPPAYTPACWTSRVGFTWRLTFVLAWFIRWTLHWSQTLLKRACGYRRRCQQANCLVGLATSPAPIRYKIRSILCPMGADYMPILWLFWQ